MRSCSRDRFGIRDAAGYPVVCLLAFLLLLSGGCSKEKTPGPRELVRPVKLYTVSGEASSPTRSRELPGVVRAARRVDLAFQVSGPLVELSVEEGRMVKKGDVVARILPRDFETDLKKASARALEAEQQYRRYKDLYIRKQVSKADFDRYKSQFDVAKAREKEARDALEDTVLRAPFSGVIAKRYVDNFKEVRAKEPIVSLQDLSELEVVVDVPENMMARVRNRPKGPVADAEFASAPGRKFPLTIKEYASEADPRTQTYRVTLRMKAPSDVNILPGMTATVRARGGGGTKKDGADAGVVIPAVAVFADEAGTSQVWVVDRGSMTVSRREVKTGELTGTDRIRILDGLSPGETIAVTGVTQLRDGMKVRDLSRVKGYGE